VKGRKRKRKEFLTYGKKGAFSNTGQSAGRGGKEENPPGKTNKAGKGEN